MGASSAFGLICFVFALSMVISIRPVVGQQSRESKRNEDQAIGSPNPDSDEPHMDDKAASNLGKLNGSLRSIDWENESKNASQAIAKVFERNGWNDESHRFARDVAVKVAAIPPWDLNGRLQVVTSAVKERYDLPSEAADQFRSKIFREVVSLVVRNAKSITETTAEAVQTRQAGKPFTSEQVARWCNESTEFLKDGAQTAERLVKELEAAVPPEKRDQLHKDWESYVTRQNTIDFMMEKWKKGDWDPSQWGMDADPIQMKKPPFPTDDVPSLTRSRPDEAARMDEPPTRERKLWNKGGASVTVAGPPGSAVKVDDSHWDPNDPPTWAAYVRFTRKKYQFDPAQSSSADSIHAELLERATAYLMKHADTLGSVPVGMRAQNSEFEPIRQLFAELKDRLEFLPTTGQRETNAR
ncbi:MAG: hypothetical protein HY287_06480 [Planctomycetes bacterium]|nr:hypothetical protein [Planctomycetota bacterium]MBI3833959.1 hypothetical protein [Planctomycetota bacterium]